MQGRNYIEAVKSGLTQYIAALKKESGREGKDSMHLAIAAFTEVLLDSTRSKDRYDMFLSKPILRAAKILVMQFYEKSLENFPAAEKDLEPVKQAANIIQKIIDTTDRTEQ